MGTDTQTLAEYGWNPQIQEQFDALGSDTAILGRVVRVDRGSFLFATEHGVDRCHLVGTSWPDPGPPVTGDWVAARLEPGFGMIADVVLPRSSEIKRVDPSDTGTQVLVANIDTMFVLHGLDRPHRVGRVERFCLTTWDAGATPVVLITKTDLEDSG